MVPPSILPSGQKLKENIVQASAYTYFNRKYFKALTLNPKYQNVVPEIIFQDIYVTIEKKFFASFQLLENSPSNLIHQSIANITDNSETCHFTTNFDLLVDKYQSNSNKTIHLHGSLNDPEEMTMRIYKIGPGVGYHNESMFLTGAKNKTLFVLGYSGNDTDIVKLINKSEVKEIYWMMWDLTDNWTLNNIQRIKRPVKIFEDNLEDFFQEINRKRKLKLTKDDYDLKKSILEIYSKTLSRFEKNLVLGHLLFRVSDFNNAKEVFKKILDKKLFNNSLEYVSTIIFYTDTLRVIGESYTEAVKLLKDGYKLKNVDEVKLAEIQNMIGLVIMDLDPNPGIKPISFFTKSIKIFNRLLVKSPSNASFILPKLARVHNNIGLSYNENSKFNGAELHYKLSITIKKKEGNYLGMATSMSNLLLLFLTANQKSKYYYWRRKTMNLIEKYEMDYRYSFLLREEGRFHIGRQKKTALKKLMMAKRILINGIPSAKRDLKIIMELINKANAT